VIINGSQLEGELDRLAELLEQAAHIGLDGVETLNLLVVVHEHIAIDLVDEDLVPDVVLDAARRPNHVKQLLARALVVRVVRIDHVDQSAALLNVLLAIAFEHVVSREVVDAELDIGVVVDFLLLNIGSGQQEEGLVRAHLLEDHLRDRRLARLGHPHQTNVHFCSNL